jgi:hypothetical protein
MRAPADAHHLSGSSGGRIDGASHMDEHSRKQLAGVLREAAHVVAAAPSAAIGYTSVAMGHAGQTGPVVGTLVTATHSGGGSGPVIGLHVSATAGAQSGRAEMAAQLSEAVELLEGEGKVPVSMLRLVIERLGEVARTVPAVAGLAKEAASLLVDT